VRVSFSQQLFGYSGAALPQPPDLVAFALALGRTAPTTPTVIACETTGYEHVPGMDATAWAPVVATRDLFLSDLTGDGIAADVLTIQAMLNQIAWLQNLYDTFGYDLDAALDERAEQVNQDARTLQALVASIRSDPTVSQTATRCNRSPSGPASTSTASPASTGARRSSTAAGAASSVSGWCCRPASSSRRSPDVPASTSTT
jgi:hypothetical protein